MTTAKRKTNTKSTPKVDAKVLAEQAAKLKAQQAEDAFYNEL